MLLGYGAMPRGLLPGTVAETSLLPSLAYSTTGSTHLQVALVLLHLFAGMKAVGNGGGGSGNDWISGVSEMVPKTFTRQAHVRDT